MTLAIPTSMIKCFRKIKRNNLNSLNHLSFLDWKSLDLNKILNKLVVRRNFPHSKINLLLIFSYKIIELLNTKV